MLERIKEKAKLFVTRDRTRYECSLTTCTRSTRNPTNSDPAKRWLIGAELVEEDGSIVRINLCPNHIRTYFPQTTPEFFESMRTTEKLIKATNETEVIQ